MVGAWTVSYKIILCHSIHFITIIPNLNKVKYTSSASCCLHYSRKCSAVINKIWLAYFLKRTDWFLLAVSQMDCVFKQWQESRIGIKGYVTPIICDTHRSAAALKVTDERMDILCWAHHFIPSPLLLNPSGPSYNSDRNQRQNCAAHRTSSFNGTDAPWWCRRCSRQDKVSPPRH